jgi:hypothetical protein
MDKIYSQLISKLHKEIMKDDNEIKSKVLDPLVSYIGSKILPYICFAIFVLVFMLVSIIILFLMVYTRNLNSKMISVA